MTSKEAKKIKNGDKVVDKRRSPNDIYSVIENIEGELQNTFIMIDDKGNRHEGCHRRFTLV